MIEVYICIVSVILILSPLVYWRVKCWCIGHDWHTECFGNVYSKKSCKRCFMKWNDYIVGK